MRITLNEREVTKAVLKYVAEEVLRSTEDGGEVYSLSVVSGVYGDVVLEAYPDAE